MIDKRVVDNGSVVYPAFAFANSFVSCGVNQLYNLSQVCRAATTIDNEFYAFIVRRSGGRKFGGVLMFSDNVSYGNGKRFADFITNMEFGRVFSSGHVQNPQYTQKNHLIECWMWVPDYEKIFAWVHEQDKLFNQYVNEYNNEHKNKAVVHTV